MANTIINNNNPWLGFQTYQEADARKFKGRSADINELYKLVKNSPIVVCYSDSGIGKSSLIYIIEDYPLLKMK